MLDQNNSLLVVIDVQGKLAEVMHESAALFENINRLAAAAKALDVHVLVSEQLPDKLGPTREELADTLSGAPVVSKSAFSCCGESSFNSALESYNKKQIVLCGIETHICVTQTALDLLEKNYEVFVGADAVSSRNPRNRDLALERMRQQGAQIIPTESALFEWMRDAAHPAFREVRKLLA